MDSYMLAVEKAFTKHLSDFIKTTDGYNFDMTGRVFRGRGYFGGRRSDPLPMISLLMSPEIDPETIQAGRGEVRTREVLYFLQGWVDFDRGLSEENPSDTAHLLLADVKKALSYLIKDEAGDYYMLRAYNPNGVNMLHKLEIGMGLVRPPEEPVSPDAAYFWLPLRFGFIESMTDPNALPQ